MINHNHTTQNTSRTRSLVSVLCAALLAITGLGFVASSATAAPGDLPDFDILIPEIPFPDFTTSSDVGNLVTFSPQTKAQSAEVNQNFSDIKDSLNAKTAGGIDYDTSDESVDVLGVAPVSVSSVEVTIPYSGYVKLDFTGYVRSLQAEGDNSLRCAIKTDVSSPDVDENRVVGSRRYWNTHTLSASGGAYFAGNMASSGVYWSTLAGTVTFHVVCNANKPAQVYYRSLIATFHEDRL
jgi:hypothetical protein